MPVVSISIETTPDLSTFGGRDFDTEVRNAFSTHGKEPLVRIMERFSGVLEPGRPEDVGASGRASQNLFTDVRGSMLEGIVYEGRNTPANAAIRNGIKPGRWVPFDVLKQWVADKGIKLYYNDDDGISPDAIVKKITTKSGTEYNRSQWFRPSGMRPHTNLTAKTVTTKAIYAIRYALWKEGTQRPTANWFPLMPSGKGSFDYPSYVMIKDNVVITNIVGDFGNKLAVEITKRMLGAK